jgi:hypothetical protein
MVTFWFVDENKVKQFVTLYAFEFIDRLVKLIPDKNLKLIWAASENLLTSRV